MNAKWTALVMALFTAVFGLFGTPGKAAAANSITVTGATQASDGSLKIVGKGNYTLAAGSTLAYIDMTVSNGKMTVSTTLAIVDTKLMQWSSISDVLPAGTYTVSAILYVNVGGLPVPVGSTNSLSVTIK